MIITWLAFCDQEHLFAAVDGGGAVTFACSGTISLGSPIILTSNTTIDGSGQSVVLDAGEYAPDAVVVLR
jgi:hypothetical protein